MLRYINVDLDQECVISRRPKVRRGLWAVLANSSYIMGHTEEV